MTPAEQAVLFAKYEVDRAKTDLEEVRANFTVALHRLTDARKLLDAARKGA